MAGDMKGSLVRKVFKNFSINEYFDELLQDKRVLKELAIIQEMWFFKCLHLFYEKFWISFFRNLFD